MQAASMLRPLASLWLLAVVLLEWTCSRANADPYSFCARPANMDLCWWNNVNKRFLRFGRGDPFLRFGRGDPILRFGRGDPILRFGKRAVSDVDEEDYNNGYLRFGRSAHLPPPLLAELLAKDEVAVRRKRDVTEEQTAENTRAKREADKNDAGFVRWGRGGAIAGDDLEPETPAKKADADLDTATGDRGYLRFGRGQSGFPRFGKRYLRFGREGYLRFGKRPS